MLSARPDRSESLKLHERALALRQRVLGAAFSSVAISLINVAELWGERDFARSEEMLLRAARIRESSGPGYDGVLGSCWNHLGRLYRDHGDPRRAVGAFQQALEVTRRCLGPDHPGVADIEYGLGTLLCGLDRAPEAVPLLEHATAVCAINPDMSAAERESSKRTPAMRATSRVVFQSSR